MTDPDYEKQVKQFPVFATIFVLASCFFLFVFIRSLVKTPGIDAIAPLLGVLISLGPIAFLPFAYLWLLDEREKQRRARGRCPTCNYDLRRVDGPCPECGAER